MSDAQSGQPTANGAGVGASSATDDDALATAAPVAVSIKLAVVTARRCDGRVSTILNKRPTAADPWFFTADNGTTYVVKLSTTPDRTAFNEVLFGQLARHVALPAPEVVAIRVSADLIADDPELSAINYPPGVHVGVARLPNGSFDLRGDVLKTLGPSLKIENESELPATVVFSSWIEDHDHKTNDGNWMLEPREDNKYAVWIIDFGHALRGDKWTVAKITPFSDPTTVQILGPHEVAASACARHPYAPAVQRIEALTQEQITELIKTVPTDWQPGEADRAVVATFLVTRRPGLELFKGKP